jgi:hypothetical protein
MRGNVRFSNRPFGVKRFQTIHHEKGCDVLRVIYLRQPLRHMIFTCDCGRTSDQMIADPD